MTPPSTEAPAGTLALVFTDVEASTELWEEQPELMRDALAVHDALFRATLAAHSGYEVKTQGDAFMIAFPDALAATRFCGAMQAALAVAPWPPGLVSKAGARGVPGLAVRMGIGLGSPHRVVDPTTGRVDYYGGPVNRAARVAAAGHGGQVLLSEAARAQVVELAREAAPTLDDLGKHRLKGFEGVERLYQLEAPGRTFPPLRTMAVVRHNLPLRADSFVGRRGELRQIADELGVHTRALTLLGPGGFGKTRLALEAARQAHDRDLDLLCTFVDLSGSPTLAEAATAVTTACGVAHDGDGHQWVRRVGEALRVRGPLWLVLDNCEQLCPALGPVVEELLAQAPGLCVLASSQAPLGLRAERTLELTPLPAAEAMRLFVDRSGHEDDAAVRGLVARLEGIPLALELAAARSAVWSPAQLAESLLEPSGLLGAAAPGLPARRGTLGGTIAWSFDLLSGEEREAMAWWSCFRGGFDALQAAHILELPLERATELVLGLLRRSLLRREAPQGDEPPRFHMYDSIRAYSAGELDHLRPKDDVALRHARAVTLALEADAATWQATGHLAALRRLKANTENLALAARVSDPEWAVRALLVLAIPWSVVGMFRPLHELLLRSESMVVPTSLQARLALERGAAHARTSDFPRAEELLTQAVAVARQPADLELVCRALLERGKLRVAATGTGRDDIEEALDLARRIGHRRYEAMCRRSLFVYFCRNAPLASKALVTEARRLFAEVGDPAGEAQCICNLAAFHVDLGEFEQAEAMFHQALTLFRACEDKPWEGYTMGALSSLYVSQGRYDDAVAAARTALAQAQESGEDTDAARANSYLGNAHHFIGQLDGALHHYAEAHRLGKRLGMGPMEHAMRFYLGSIHQERGEFDLAGEHYDAALEGYATTRDALGRGFCHALRSSLASEQGDTATAQRHLQAARLELTEHVVPCGPLLAEQAYAHAVLARAVVIAGQGRGHEALQRVMQVEALLERPTPFVHNRDVQVSRRVLQAALRRARASLGQGAGASRA